ncbi:MAG TPA: methyltransferase domain-containing protein [Longimicrobium sp.]|jgi:2-polyprenyl-3-methyl-5-hydroxy-6-metoxy-1,4-benzoquinol methylase
MSQMNADSGAGNDLEQAYNVYTEAGLGAFSTADTDAGAALQYEVNYGHLLPAARDTRFLDVGCGAGSYLLWLRSRGFERLHGVDLSEVAVSHCHAAGLRDVEQVRDLTGYLAAHPGEFDVISLNDVIEHFTQDEMLPTLNALRQALKPGGMVLVKTLNMGNIGGLYMRYNDFTHRLGFTETSMRQVLVAAGFTGIEVVEYRVPTRSIRGKIWGVVGGAWRDLFGALLLLDVGVDRPRVRSKTLLAVARTRA